MEEKARELSERLLDYGVEIVKLTMKIGKTATGKQITILYLRSHRASPKIAGFFRALLLRPPEFF